MDLKNTQIKYDVALSFAGEDREYVEMVASHLRQRGIEVFYDKYQVVTLWGRNLYDHLSDVYENKARFTIIFISAHYAKKLWTNHERISAQARAFRESQEYILPARFDDTAIPGLLETVGYISLKEISPEELCNLICTKLSERDAIVTDKGLPNSKTRAANAIKANLRSKTALVLISAVLVAAISLIAGVVFYALQQWAPQRNSDKKYTFNVTYDAIIDGVKDPIRSMSMRPAIDELIKILDNRAEKIVEYFGIEYEDDIEKFKNLHTKHKESLKNHDIILAHEICREIYDVLNTIKAKRSTLEHIENQKEISDGLYTDKTKENLKLSPWESYTLQSVITFYSKANPYIHINTTDEYGRDIFIKNRKKALLKYEEYLKILESLW
jgi:hypothetical protein